MQEQHPIQRYYESLNPANEAALLFIRKLILDFDDEFTEHLKWNAPFFYYRKQMCCYFWVNKKSQQPYLAFGEGKFMDHPALQQEGRKRFKVYHIDVAEDIPVHTLHQLLQLSIDSIQARKPSIGS